MLKKCLIMFVGIFLGFNSVNAFNKPYLYGDLLSYNDYMAEYEFISYKYGTLELWIESSKDIGTKQSIGSYELNDSCDINDFNLLDLSRMFYYENGVFSIIIDEHTGDLCSDLRDIHPLNYSMCTNNPYHIDFKDYDIEYVFDKNDDYRVTVVKGQSKINSDTFEIYAVFNHAGGAFKKVIYD